MNFYQAQDQARRQTFWLVGLFVLAVLTLIVLTNLCVAVFVWYSDPEHVIDARHFGGPWDYLVAIVSGLGWYKFFWVSALVCGTVALAMWFKWLGLRDGGRVVAESLGGRLLAPNSNELKQRQLLNVVEEMALASGIPVPPVYVLEHEAGINAFAAGLSLEDAVIGVSRGAMEGLNREQLQGVVAHEFSHILNGDMRLNLKIVAVLHGILMIAEAGQTLLHVSSRRRYRRSRDEGKGIALVLALGLALFVIGWLGSVFGSLIRAAVSRQREYLADASAVQFTRNPDGIAGALRVIGGHTFHSRIQHERAHELGHLFFSQAYKSFWLATHPPLDTRIQRILPAWDGSYLEAERQLDQQAMESHAQSFQERQQGAFSLVDEASVAAMGAAVEVASQVPETSSFTIPQGLREAARDPFSAAPLALAVLLDSEESIQLRQFELVAEHSPSWSEQMQAYLPELKILSKSAFLPVLDLLLPAIKCLSASQYTGLRSAMAAMVRADGRVDLLEWVWFELLRQHGDRHFGLARAPKATYKTLKQVSGIYAVVLSRLALIGQTGDQERLRAFGKGANVAGVYTVKLLPEEKCTQAAFTRAVHDLNKAFPLLKPRLLKGLVAAAKQDGKVCEHERMIIETIAVIWDCPLVGLEAE